MTFELAIDIALLLCFVVYAVLSGISWRLERKRIALLRRKHQRQREQFEGLVKAALEDPTNPQKKLAVTLTFLDIILRDPTEGLK